MNGEKTYNYIFVENEWEANRYAAHCMRIMSLVALVAWILNLAGIFIVPARDMNVGMSLSILIFLLPTAICRWITAEKWWVKSVIMFCCVLGITIASIAIPKHTILIWATPIILSCHYYSKKLTANTLMASVIFLIIAGVASLYVGEGDPNLMGAMPVSEAVITPRILKYSILFYMLPRALIVMELSFICSTVAERTHDLLEKQAKDSSERQRLETELSVATSIQLSMLPNQFLPDYPRFDLFASMTPAKEVGGDFYDFYMLDDDHLCITVADVSGKGVPAALFMAHTMTLLKNRMMEIRYPSRVLNAVNKELCVNNDEVFVTAWLGVLDLTTGVLTYANAGHERPLLGKTGQGGVFRYEEQEPGFVLGGLEDITYRSGSITLWPGDTLFLYTDGVVEAENEKEELFGTERLENWLNEGTALKPKELLPFVEQAVKEFAGKAEQFDDITMLCLKYQGEV